MDGLSVRLRRFKDPPHLPKVFLEHIFTSSSTPRFLSPVIIVVLGDDHDAGIRERRLYLPAGTYSIESLHLDVHQNPIWLMGCIRLKRLRAVAAFVDGFGGFAYDLSDQSAHLIVILHDQ